MPLRRTSVVALCCMPLWLGACSVDVAPVDEGPRSRSREARGGAGKEAERGAVRLVQSNRPPPRSSVPAVVGRVLPSVVNVRVTALDDSPFGTGRARGEGSGVVIAREGIIVTNAHVVQGALDVTVVVRGRGRMQGTVVGTAPERDLAVIEVDADDLKPIELGHSSGPNGVRLGDPVVAVGFPLGLGQGATVTSGIVSGVNRNIDVGDPNGSRRLVGMLQTDAAINPGNSGGALVDLAGRLIGINSAAAAASAAENIGFAIAIDDALPVIEEILSEPLEKRAWLGVQVVPVDEVVAAQLGLPPGTRGAAIGGTIPESPAERAGVREAEVIVALDGTTIESANDLTEALTEHEPGDRVEVELVSAAGRRTVVLELGQRPPAFAR